MGKNAEQDTTDDDAKDHLSYDYVPQFSCLSPVLESVKVVQSLCTNGSSCAHSLIASIPDFALRAGLFKFSGNLGGFRLSSLSIGN